MARLPARAPRHRTSRRGREGGRARLSAIVPSGRRGKSRADDRHAEGGESGVKRVKDTREPRYTHCQREGCGKPRRRPKGKWAVDAWLDDLYCSTECAKAVHGVV